MKRSSVRPSLSHRSTAAAASLLLSAPIRGVVVNFDLGERFPTPRSQQPGSLRPRARRVAVLGVGAAAEEVRGGKFFEIFDAKSRVWG